MRERSSYDVTGMGCEFGKTRGSSGGVSWIVLCARAGLSSSVATLTTFALLLVVLGFVSLLPLGLPALRGVGGSLMVVATKAELSST